MAVRISYRSHSKYGDVRSYAINRREWDGREQAGPSLTFLFANEVERGSIMVTSGEVKKNLTHGDAWLRVFFMIVFAFVYWVVNWLLAAVVLVQIGWSLITANTSGRLREFGASLADYLRQIVRFITYNSDDMPFPFADWPGRDQEE